MNRIPPDVWIGLAFVLIMAFGMLAIALRNGVN
jgi:hypothetical protein